MSTLPYPPPYQDIDVLCAHLCISPSTVEAWMRVRNRVIEALREAGRPLEVKDIQLAAGLCTRNAADILLGKMARDSEITRVDGVGRFENGDVAEIFLNTRKHGTAVDVNARDAAVAASLLLQHGCPVDALRKALTRNSDGSASGPLARALDLLGQA